MDLIYFKLIVIKLFLIEVKIGFVFDFVSVIQILGNLIRVFELLLIE